MASPRCRCRPHYRSNRQLGRGSGDHNYRPVRIFLRDEDQHLRGGILADLWGGWMHITYLWVDDDLRGRDYGTQLLQAAEGEARTHGCHHVHVETFSFQGAPFL
ncbi:MAG: GNAT family N-acetyltransferase [Anaerolineae bacterium]